MDSPLCGSEYRHSAHAVPRPDTGLTDLCAGYDPAARTEAVAVELCRELMFHGSHLYQVDGSPRSCPGKEKPDSLRRRPEHRTRPEPVELLTEDERYAIRITADLANALGRIVGHDTTRAGDLNELLGHVHVLQQAVMSQAAARAYPDLYRRLGERLPATQRTSSSSSTAPATPAS